MTMRRVGIALAVGVVGLVLSACSAAPGERDESSSAEINPLSSHPHQQLAACTTPPTTGCEGYSRNIGWFALTNDGTCPDLVGPFGTYQGFTSAQFLTAAGFAEQCAQSSGYASQRESWAQWLSGYSDDMDWSQPFCAYKWVPSPVVVQNKAVESNLAVLHSRSICDVASSVEVVCEPVRLFGPGAPSHGTQPNCMGACYGWGM